MWVFIEQVGELYVGVAHDDEGRQLLEITQPVSCSDIRTRMKAVLSTVDCVDIDNAIYDAEHRPSDGRTTERRSFHLIRVRAMAGLATDADAAYVVDQLHDSNSVHRTTLLLWSLGYMGAQYEPVVAAFLNDQNTNGEAEYAMRALFEMGLLDKYVDLFVEWLRGAGPPKHHRIGSLSYGMATHAFRESKNAKILRALVDASNDTTERHTTREHARRCLAQAMDIDHAPLGKRLVADHPYYVGALKKAEALLKELGAGEPGRP